MALLTPSASDAADAARASTATARNALGRMARAVMRVLVAVPAVAGRLGVVAGKFLAKTSGAVAQGSDRAKYAVATAQVRAADAAHHAQQLARELEVQGPRLITKADRRRTRRRKVGKGATVAAVVAGIGAGVAVILRRRSAAGEALPEVAPPASSEALDGDHVPVVDEVIDVASAER